MPLHDLTPQLRTRLNRMERAVGLFVALAALLLLAGFVYYLRQTAQRKGWFLQKVPYYIYVQDATGLKPGDPVRMMGFEIGQITAVVPMPPTQWFVENRYNVFVQFEVIEPNYGYIWTDSLVKVDVGDFLGNRMLEVVKGQTGAVTVVEQNGRVSDLLSEHVADTYVPLTRESKGVWLTAEEAPPVTEKVDQLVRAVESALPVLTNQLGLVLTSSAEAISNVNWLALSARPAATNLVEITRHLRDPDGALGRWLFPTTLQAQLQTTLTSAQGTLASADATFTRAQTALGSADTNLVLLAEKLGMSLDNVAAITSNLNLQVQANSNILSSISQMVVHADQLMQGLQRHWFLRSAFRTKTNRPPERTKR